MAREALNHFDECTVEFVHLPSQEEQCTSCFRGGNKIYTPGTIAKLHRALTEIK